MPMFSSTSLPKHGGAGRSGLFDSLKHPSKSARRSVIADRCRTASLFPSLILAFILTTHATASDKSTYSFTRSAADKCDSKLKAMEDFAAKRKSGSRNTTRFSENEVNSYLAFHLSKKYHPSLKSLVVTFEENGLQTVASVDFDRLGTTQNKFLPKIMALLFSGTHTLDAHGQLISDKGNAHFLLERARFDESVLPKSIVEGIITAVGRKQNPPFDPLQPSKMPYEIKEVDVHPGYIVVYQ
jgi:hypothetical protein